MLTASTVPTTVFWQWANQTYNVCVNYANRNASNALSYQQIGTAYVGAVVSSCSIAVGLRHAAQRLERPLLRSFIPFVAVATAGAINVALMRSNELLEGIAVKDEDGVGLFVLYYFFLYLIEFFSVGDSWHIIERWSICYHTSCDFPSRPSGTSSDSASDHPQHSQESGVDAHSTSPQTRRRSWRHDSVFSTCFTVRYRPIPSGKLHPLARCRGIG